jgi:hypothetical protein
VWLGFLSAFDWGALPGAVERRLPPGCSDATYLAELEALPTQIPRPTLAFVIAGGDVLAGDALGGLRLSLKGARRRDVRVARALRGVPSVWLPGGGYQPAAWKVMAGTVLVLRGQARRRIPGGFDPLRARFRRVSRQMNEETLRGSLEITEEDLQSDLRLKTSEVPKVLGFYTPQGLEYGLFRYGILPFLERVGYRNLRVEVRPTGAGDEACVYGWAEGQRHALIQCVLSRVWLGADQQLFVNWLSLRNPRAHFSDVRPRLPGQEVPGLGLAREMGEILARMARRLGLAGVAFRPAWYHLAVIASSRFRFHDPARQGRFEALVRDLRGLTLLQATEAVAARRVWKDGQPYMWEADEMVVHLRPTPLDRTAVEEERERAHFEYVPA